MDKLGQALYLNDRGDYLILYNYVKSRPHLVQDVMNGNFNAHITLEAIQLNADIDDMQYRGGDIDLDQEEIDLILPLNRQYK